jgi:TatD DNase family protein
MIDTHCHLTDPRLFPQLDGVLSRAASAGVARMVTIGTHPADWPAVIAVCRRRANVRCAIGVHPNYCHEVDFDQLPQLRQLQADPAVVALGEMGLDYHHHYAPKDRQAKFLEWQLDLARELERPVVIHCREAIDDCLAILRNYPKLSCVFHCFTGTRSEAERILAAGYLIGFTGVVTFKNGAALRELAAAMPSDRLLVETDAPYLSPEPVRSQKTNEPSFVMHTAAVVAAARKVSLAELDALTTANASSFYRWK